MPATIGNGVTHRGINDTKYNHVWNISGATTQADLGKAVVQDTTADSTAKLSTAGGKVIGALTSYENRVVEGIQIGTVSHKGYFPFTYSGTNPARGDGVVGGATAGVVAGTGAAALPGQATIVALDTVAKIVLVAIGIF